MNMSPKPKRTAGMFRLPVHVYLAYLLICTLVFTGTSLAHYVSSANGSDSGRVAAGVVVVSSVDNSALTIKQPGGDDTVVTDTFQFSVSNSNGAVSEVAIKYDVIVTLDSALPAGVSMTLDGKACSDSSNTFTFKNAGTFDAGVSKTNTHTLSVTGDYSTISAPSTLHVTIRVLAEQID